MRLEGEEGTSLVLSGVEDGPRKVDVRSGEERTPWSPVMDAAVGGSAAPKSLYLLGFDGSLTFHDAAGETRVEQAPPSARQIFAAHGGWDSAIVVTRDKEIYLRGEGQWRKLTVDSPPGRRLCVVAGTHFVVLLFYPGRAQPLAVGSGEPHGARRTTYIMQAATATIHGHQYALVADFYNRLQVWDLAMWFPQHPSWDAQIDPGSAASAMALEPCGRGWIGACGEQSGRVRVWRDTVLVMDMCVDSPISALAIVPPVGVCVCATDGVVMVEIPGAFDESP